MFFIRFFEKPQVLDYYGRMVVFITQLEVRGEPFYMKEFRKFVNTLVEKGVAKNIHPQILAQTEHLQIKSF